MESITGRNILSLYTMVSRISSFIFIFCGLWFKNMIGYYFDSCRLWTSLRILGKWPLDTRFIKYIAYKFRFSVSSVHSSCPRITSMLVASSTPILGSILSGKFKWLLILELIYCPINFFFGSCCYDQIIKLISTYIMSLFVISLYVMFSIDSVSVIFTISSYCFDR